METATDLPGKADEQTLTMGVGGHQESMQVRSFQQRTDITAEDLRQDPTAKVGKRGLIRDIKLTL